MEGQWLTAFLSDDYPQTNQQGHRACSQDTETLANQSNEEKGKLLISVTKTHFCLDTG